VVGVQAVGDQVAAGCAFGVYPVAALPAALQGAGCLDQAAGDGAGGLPGAAEATASSACRKGSGNSRPRLRARRRMPAAAFGLKKYLDRSARVSKTSGNEDTAASLGHSEPLRVQNSPRHAVPQVIQVAQDSGEVPAGVDRKEPRDVLAEEPTGACLSQEPHDVPPQSRTWVSQAATMARDRVSLAGPPGGEHSSIGNKPGCS
jgi:hypothetical protein